MKKLLKSVLTFSFILLLAACNNESSGLPAQGGDGGNNGGDNGDAGSLVVDPANPSLSAGETIEIGVINLQPDGTEVDVTDDATITSSNPDVVSVGPGGQLTGVSEGTSDIIISYGDLETTITVTVGPAESVGLEVLPGSNTSVAGLEIPFIANELFSDGSKTDVTVSANWVSSDTNVATISSPGLVKTLTAGDTTITASLGEQEASSALKVTPATIDSIDVNPTTVDALAAGTSQQITVTAFLSDGTSQDITELLTWSSADETVATVNDSGLITGVAPGNTTITVSVPSEAGGQSKTIPVTVTNATVTQMSISPSTTSLAKGTNQQFTVSANFSDGTKGVVTDSATWESSAPNIASVDENGLVKAIAKGSAEITATIGSQQATSTVTITDAALSKLTIETDPSAPVSIEKGGEVKVSVIATFSDSSKVDVTDQTTLTSADTSVATITTDNNIYAKGEGATQVTARFNSKDSLPIDITVTNATVTDITFEPATMSLIVGTTGKFTATAIFSDDSERDVSDELTWQSADSGSVTVDQTGLVKAIAVTAGTDITASYGGQTKTLTVVVEQATLNSIEVTPDGETIGIGETLQFKAVGTLSNNTTIDGTNDVIWTSSDTSIAQIGTDGLAEAKGQGTATITAEFNGVTSSADLIIGPAVPQRLHINFKAKGLDILGLIQISVGAGGDLFKLSSELYYSDGSNEEPNSNEVQYISSNAGLVEIDLEGNATLVSADVVGSSEVKGIYTDVSTLEEIESENLVSVECLSQVQILFIGLGLSCDIESIDNPDVD